MGEKRKKEPELDSHAAWLEGYHEGRRTGYLKGRAEASVQLDRDAYQEGQQDGYSAGWEAGMWWGRLAREQGAPLPNLVESAETLPDCDEVVQVLPASGAQADTPEEITDLPSPPIHPGQARHDPLAAFIIVIFTVIALIAVVGGFIGRFPPYLVAALVICSPVAGISVLIRNYRHPSN